MMSECDGPGWVTRAICREAHWTTYYKLIERAHVSVVDLSIRLLLLAQPVFPAEVVNLIIDDTRVPRMAKTGPGISVKHDHARKANRPTFLNCQCWVTLALVVRVRLGSALTVPIRSWRVEESGQRGKLWVARQLIDSVRGHVKDTRLLIDAWFMRKSLILPLLEQRVRIIGQVRRDTALFLPPEAEPKRRGRPLVITAAPEDPRVAVTLFSTGNWSDRRTDAISRMESYLAAGAMMPAQLYGHHLTGQKSLAFACESDVANLDVGETLVLSVEDGPELGNRQFVRVARIISRRATKFRDPDKGEDFYLDVVVAEITEALRSDFPSYFNGAVVRGGAPKPPDKLPTLIRRSVVADAARFFGISTLVESAAIGATSIRAQSTQSQVVPAAQGEIPIVDASPWADREVMLALDTTWSVSAPSGLNLAPGGRKRYRPDEDWRVHRCALRWAG